MVTAAASGAGQASVVRPPVGAGPLGAAAAGCASPRAGVGHGLEGGARVGPWRCATASMTTRMRRVLVVPAVAGAMVTRSRRQGLRSCDFGGSMPPRAAS
jgi:hypothetical protein